MRSDALGFFWRDEPVIRAPKAEKVKRTPPPRTWEDPSFLPYLDEAKAFNVPLFTPDSLYQAMLRQEPLEWDMEVYGNYTLVGFRGVESGLYVFYETFNDVATPQSIPLACLQWILDNFMIIGFNSKHYDEPMVSMVLAGKTNMQVKIASNKIIAEEMPGHMVLKQFKVKRVKDLNHIDLKEVAPSKCSLKLYAGRMHSDRMQDLPFAHDTILSWEQALIIRLYNVKDLKQTGQLYKSLSKQLALRVAIGNEHGEDLRSKSDAQIAESVIASELRRMGIARPQPPTLLPGTVYYYQTPRFINFQTENMKWVLNLIQSTAFVVGEKGSIGLPQHLKDLLIPIGKMKYQMGIGGLHSTEKSIAHIASDDMLLLDTDVESYYPRIIMVLGIFPAQIGPAFLKVYGGIVERRVNAKRRKDKVTADSLKITINGAYGKLGSVFSFLYAPDKIIQVTLTGQLCLLMLIERLEMYGFEVVSANTDGLVTKVPTARRDHFNAIVEQWRDETGFNTEETQYKALYSRDVNNYLAVKEKGYKAKGVFANPWDADPEINDTNEQLKHNPANLISIEAAIACVRFGTPVAETIRKCKDMWKFITVRTVNGGACKLWADGGVDYLGKAIRWYYAKGVEGEIVGVLKGNKVARSDGAKPLMELPTELADDIDYEWYEAEAENILKSIAFSA